MPFRCEGLGASPELTLVRGRGGDSGKRIAVPVNEREANQAQEGIVTTELAR